jgi:hypothetical protein
VHAPDQDRLRRQRELVLDRPALVAVIERAQPVAGLERGPAPAPSRRAEARRNLLCAGIVTGRLPSCNSSRCANSCPYGEIGAHRGLSGHQKAHFFAAFLKSRRGDSNSRPLHYEGARGCSVESRLVVKHLANLHVFERRVPPPKTRSGNFMFLFCSVKPAGQSRGNRDPFENWQAWALQHWDVTHVVVGANARLAPTLRLGPAASPTRLPGRA